jgi:hypothetical protein
VALHDLTVVAANVGLRPKLTFAHMLPRGHALANKRPNTDPLMAWAPVDYEHGGVYGPGDQPVQGLLAGVSAVGAWGDRGTGLRAGGVADCAGGSGFL